MLGRMSLKSRIERLISMTTAKLADWVDPADDWTDPSPLRVIVSQAGERLASKLR